MKFKLKQITVIFLYLTVVLSIVFIIIFLNEPRYIKFHFNKLILLFISLLVIFPITIKFISFFVKIFILKTQDTVQAVEIKNLKANEKYRKEFLGDISHELKTPIFNIQGYVLTLIDGGLYDKKINKKYLKRTEKNINRLISIVEDLEIITKLEAGELKLNIKMFDINSIINEVFEMQEIKAQKKNIQLKLEKTKEKHFVYADKERILEVLNNLVSNSINYGIENGITQVRINETEKNVLIEVADNGIGIEKKYLKRIFERFFRIDKSRSKKLGGTGLGLSIVKHIIDGHKRTIKVISELNKGTVFKFSLKKANEK